jgi:hypothetical protein
MPKALHEPFDFVPYGCESIADLCVQDGMEWKGVQWDQEICEESKGEKGNSGDRIQFSMVLLIFWIAPRLPLK